MLSLHPDQVLPTNFFDALSRSSYDAAMLLFKPEQSSIPMKQEPPGASGASNRKMHRSFTSPLSASSSFIRLNTNESAAGDHSGHGAFPPKSPARNGSLDEQSASQGDHSDVASLNLSKYFKMLEIGINRADVKKKMEKDGVDTRYIDLPSFLSGGSDSAGGNGGGSMGGGAAAEGSFMSPTGNFGNGGAGFGAGGGSIIGGDGVNGMGDGREGSQGGGYGGGFGGGFRSPTVRVASHRKKKKKKTKKTVSVAQHPSYSKYFNMLKVGTPMDVVQSKMHEEGLDIAFVSRSPDDLIEMDDDDDDEDDDEDEGEEATENDAESPRKAKTPAKEKMVPLSEHPLYAKFFKMLKVGVPLHVVKGKMAAEKLDESIIDKPPDELIPLEEKKTEDEVKMVPVSEHPLYAKYFKMLKVGVPLHVVKAKMAAEKLDEAIIDKPPDELIPLEEEKKKTEDEVKMVPVSEHPVYAKYFKMLKVGVPLHVVKAKMAAEKLDESMIDKPPDELIPLEEKKKEDVKMVPVSEHPLYAKYFKMLKVGVPLHVVKGKMAAEKLDESMIDKPPDELIPLEEEKKTEEVKMVPVSEHPLYSKFFKMLKVGVPLHVVKGKMTAENIDSSFVDKPPDELVPLNDGPSEGPQKAFLAGISGLKGKGGGTSKEKEKAVAVRKKKLHWKALDAR